MTQPDPAAAPAKPADPAPAPAPAGDPPAGTQPAKTDDTKGAAGGKDAILADLAKERDARQALQKQVDALAPLAQLAAALGVKPERDKTDVQALTEQVAAMQKAHQDAELRALRAEVAAEKKLPPALAGRLQGTTREELAADADSLATLLPAATGTSGTPAPDPSQGARGGVALLETALAEAQKKGDTREAIRLKTAIAAQKTN